MYGERWDKSKNRAKVFDAVTRLQRKRAGRYGLTAIAKEARVSRVTALKHLKTLVARGFLDVIERDWRPGIKAQRWGRSQAALNADEAQLRMRL